jgi:hypothetical protein
MWGFDDHGFTIYFAQLPIARFDSRESSLYHPAPFHARQS